MLKVLDEKYITEMGFTKNGHDWNRIVYIDGEKKNCFTIYAGSLYIRFSKTSYVNEEQLRLVYEWTKAGYIEWED